MYDMLFGKSAVVGQTKIVIGVVASSIHSAQQPLP